MLRCHDARLSVSFAHFDTANHTSPEMPAAAAIISCSTAVATGAFVSGTTALTASSSDRHDRTSKGVSITRSQHSGRLLHSVTLRYLVGGFVTISRTPVRTIRSAASKSFGNRWADQMPATSYRREPIRDSAATA